MRSRHPTSIGKIMVWIAITAFLLALLVQSIQGRTGLPLNICVVILTMLPAKRHLRLAFGRVNTGPRGHLVNRGVEFDSEAFHEAAPATHSQLS